MRTLNALKNKFYGLTERKCMMARISKEHETKNTRLASAGRILKTEEEKDAIKQEKIKNIRKLQKANEPCETNDFMVEEGKTALLYSEFGGSLKETGLVLELSQILSLTWRRRGEESRVIGDFLLAARLT